MPDLTGVEIFRAGTYQLPNETVTYTAEDVAQLAENTSKLIAAKKHEPPFKLGHDDDQAFAKMAGLPALGWATKVWAEAGRLFADFSKVPTLVMEAIAQGRYRHISSEVYDAAQTATHFGDAVKGLSLRAVALLGADIPVVKGMAPVMLAEKMADHMRLTMEVANMAEDKLMVPANRHPMDSLVGHKDEKDKKFKVHAQHPDGSYDVHEMGNPSNVKEKVSHENLTLLSEKFSQEEHMTEEQTKKAQETEAALLAEQQKNKALVAKMDADRVEAFAEKHKGIMKQPPVLAALKALALADIPTPVKLAEGKEQPHLDAVLAFAEQLIAAKPVLFGELAPSAKEDDVKTKTTEVKLAEAPFQAFAQSNGITSIEHADVAVEARKLFAEKKFPTYRECLLFLTPAKLGAYQHGNYAEPTEVK